MEEYRLHRYLVDYNKDNGKICYYDKSKGNIVYDIQPYDMDVGVSAKNMSKIAKDTDMPVQATFNNYTFVVKPGMSADEGVMAWYDLVLADENMQKNNTEEHRTPATNKVNEKNMADACAYQEADKAFFRSKKFADYCRNNYNGYIHHLLNSWEFAEFCEKEMSVQFTPDQDAVKRRAICKGLLPMFYEKHLDTVKRIQQESEKDSISNGFLSVVSHENGVYYVILSEVAGSAMTMQIPDEFFAKSGYQPQKGDRISLIEDRNSYSKCTFVLRNNGQNKKIYTTDRNSEEYKTIMDAARKRVEEALGDAQKPSRVPTAALYAARNGHNN